MLLLFEILSACVCVCTTYVFADSRLRSVAAGMRIDAMNSPSLSLSLCVCVCVCVCVCGYGE